MEGGGSEAGEGLEVFGGGVALMAGEAVAGEVVVGAEGPFIAGGFGEDGGGGDGGDLGVALDDGILGQGEVDGEGVDEEVVGLGAEGLDGAADGEPGGLIDIDAVDVGGVDPGDIPGNGASLDFGGQALTAGIGKGLAVSEAADGMIGVEDDGGGVDGSEEAAAAGLVGAGGTQISYAPEIKLAAEGAAG